jgi:ABC-type proline/glycine betaine transport system permease subunit
MGSSFLSRLSHHSWRTVDVAVAVTVIVALTARVELALRNRLSEVQTPIVEVDQTFPVHPVVCYSD